MPMPIKSNGSNDRRVCLVGVGIQPKLHISRQAIDAIVGSSFIVHFSDPQLTEILDDLRVGQREELDDLYIDGATDDDNYGSILRRIVELVEMHGSVAFVSQGNPRLGVSLVDMLDAASVENSFTLEVLPGISSFETLIIDAECDPLERGSVLVDANRWLLYRHKPNVEMDYFIYHVCSVATRSTNYSDASIGNHIHLLQASLLESYPADHPCKLIQSSGAGVGSAEVREVTVGSLVDSLCHITFATTLYVPSSTAPELDESVLRLMLS